MRCRGLHRNANSAYLSRFLFSGLLHCLRPALRPRHARSPLRFREDRGRGRAGSVGLGDPVIPTAPGFCTVRLPRIRRRLPCQAHLRGAGYPADLLAHSLRLRAVRAVGGPARNRARDRSVPPHLPLRPACLECGRGKHRAALGIRSVARRLRYRFPLRGGLGVPPGRHKALRVDRRAASPSHLQRYPRWGDLTAGVVKFTFLETAKVAIAAHPPLGRPPRVPPDRNRTRLRMHGATRHGGCQGRCLPKLPTQCSRRGGSVAHPRAATRSAPRPRTSGQR
jgi:hypothetical protein